ncbi:unnamed protein product [Alopecurus aequalis]
MKPRDKQHEKAEAARNREAIARDNAAAALRKRAEAALKLERQRRHKEAIARVDDLAATHKESALVLHLAGYIHDAAARRAVSAGDSQTMSRHIVTAHNHLDKARRLVPNCIAISNLFANVLLMAVKPDEAEKMARAAVNMASPVDPADNSVLYTVRSNAAMDQRVEDCRKSARDTLSTIERYIPRFVRNKALELDAQGPSSEAVKKAKELAKRHPSSSRAQLLSAHMQLRRICSLGPGMDRRPLLDSIRKDVEEAIASSFGGSLVFALFHAKLCFVLGLYKTFSFECIRAFAMTETVDPNLEDVPPDSVQGDELNDRVDSVYNELVCLLLKLSVVADGFWRSMPSEEQDGFLSVRLVELHKYYDTNFRNYGWDAEATIADALSFAKSNKSWRFWVCPSCAGNESLLDPDTLLEHMNSKHLPGLLSVFGSERSQYIITDVYLDQITFYQDSEGDHFCRFNKADYVLKHLSLPSGELSFSELKEEKCIRLKEILEEIEDKLKLLPADKCSSEFDEARREVQNLWFQFVEISMFDYRLIIMAFAKPFIWTKLLQSLSKDKAASKISNDDIDVIFSRGEVHAEDRMGRQPNSNIADVQSGVNSASNLLGQVVTGSLSLSSEQTTIISIYQKSIEALDKDTNGIFILNFIIQMLWNLRCFRDEFLKRRPACTLPSHEGPCISQMLHAIFTAWEKDDHHITDSLISIRDTICKVLDDSTVVQNVEVNTSSYVVTNILNGLKMPEVFLEIHLVNFPCDTKVFETLRQAANPEKELCNKEIICGEDKSFTDDKCRQADQFPVSMPEFSTLAVHIVPSEEGHQNTFLKAILSDPDLVFFRIWNTTPDKVKLKCTFVSMISLGVTQQIYQFGRLVSIVRNQNKWLLFIYDKAEAIEFNSLEELVDRYAPYLDEIHPGVCFFDNVKIAR